MNIKKSIFTILIAVVLCAAAFSMSAFAVSDEPIGNVVVEIPVSEPVKVPNETNVTITEAEGKTESDSILDPLTPAEDEAEDEPEITPEPLTPDGNMTLVDYITQDENANVEDGYKEFITVQTKNGNYFYIIIDHCGDEENVYFLNLVDEADLMSLLDLDEEEPEEPEEPEEAPATCICVDKCAVGSINIYCPVCAVDMPNCEGKEVVQPEPEEPEVPDDTEEESKAETSPYTNLLSIVVFIAIGGGAALYWFKFRKTDSKTKGGTDLDDYDFGDDDDDDDDYETEDEED